MTLKMYPHATHFLGFVNSSSMRCGMVPWEFPRDSVGNRIVVSSILQAVYEPFLGWGGGVRESKERLSLIGVEPSWEGK